ncbi:putative beta-ketoacyl-acyl carrier protein synthase III [Besnoitia besnoiti]|uniref:Putative beta-ketoacyl-acyl carrier protein synthase III n=1 Tax=Besnoitia besnoiti TaxID=94643 RepID=A0A2A9MMN0_BESBE|nr:putative beta-ketoacyl-acyl carrier protein synthase III [Besnoitia besnoiti]PFH38624.1 putative beta-ketoacyl-acyl carrier protein synthase III [Besnoitia besnoiti]
MGARIAARQCPASHLPPHSFELGERPFQHAGDDLLFARRTNPLASGSRGRLLAHCVEISRRSFSLSSLLFLIAFPLCLVTLCEPRVVASLKATPRLASSRPLEAPRVSPARAGEVSAPDELHGSILSPNSVRTLSTVSCSRLKPLLFQVSLAALDSAPPPSTQTTDTRCAAEAAATALGAFTSSERGGAASASALNSSFLSSSRRVGTASRCAHWLARRGAGAGFASPSVLASPVQKKPLLGRASAGRHDFALRGGLAAAEKERSPGAVSCGLTGCRIVGVGSATPAGEMTNDDMAAIVATSDEWVRTRTGIRSRRVLAASESLRPLALTAARRALESANVKARDIDLVLHASSSPDDLFGDATSIAAGIMQTEQAEAGSAGEKEAALGPAGFDLTAACSGFLVGLLSANAFLTSPCCPYKRILLVGADALTRWVDWSDRNTCVLFGDGAGAVVLERPDESRPSVDSEKAEKTQLRRGLLSYALSSDGLQAHQLMLPFKGAECELKRSAGKPALRVKQGGYAPLSMNGREVFKFVSRKVPPAIESVVAAAGLQMSDVDWLLLHQANKRIMDAVAERLQMPLSKVLCNLDKYGNTSAASIPLCLDEAVKEGKVKPGDVVVTAGFGAGLTWSAAVFRYG